MSNQLDQSCINTIRFLSVDMVQKANSGHPGMPLGAAPMAYVLWTRWLRYNPHNPDWVNRDRFVLSAGHGSALLYSLLHLSGYALSLDDIKQFRQWGSKAPGHPERGHTPGVETTTGPLGQCLANAVGMAIAEAQLAARYNRPGHAVIDHHTYAIAGSERRPDGRRLCGGRFAGRSPQAGQAHLPLRRQLRDPGRRHRHHFFRGSRAAFRSLWLAYADGGGRQRSRRHRGGAESGARRNGTALADPGAHQDRLRLARAGQLQGAWLTAGQGRRTPDQAETGLADRAGLPDTGAGAGTHAAGGAARQARRSGVEPTPERLRQGLPRPAHGVAGPPARRTAAGLGQGHSRIPRRRQGPGHARGVGQGDERHRAKTASAQRRLGRPRSIDQNRAEGSGRISTPPPSGGRELSRARTAAAGATPGATCTSACASMRWVPS